MKDIKQAAIEALTSNCADSEVSPRYVESIDSNLLPGVKVEQFAADLKEGDGNEMDGKFMAVHSSSALAVNCFAWFNEPDRFCLLPLLAHQGARSIRFEQKFPIFSRGKSPNLDVVIDRESELIAIESKLTEHVSKTKPKLSASYDNLAPPELAEPCWWDVYQQANAIKSQYLDIAQLLKHYFGLRTHQMKMEIKKPIRFLYLFWEPLNAADIEVFRQHRRECDILTQTTAISDIPFLWMSYLDLWKQWLNIPAVEQHARNLMNRYAVEIPCTPDCPKCGEPMDQRVLHVVTGTCWKCSSDMPIAFIDCGGVMYSPEEMTEVEKAKAKELSAHLQNRLSQTLGERYCANTCPTCRAMTGSHYLHDFYHLIKPENGYTMGLFCLACEDERKMSEENEAETL
jgi:hypothetical protein